jgi:hypothetical protein
VRLHLFGTSLAPSPQIGSRLLGDPLQALASPRGAELIPTITVLRQLKVA